MSHNWERNLRTIVLITVTAVYQIVLGNVDAGVIVGCDLFIDITVHFVEVKTNVSDGGARLPRNGDFNFPGNSYTSFTRYHLC